MLENPIVQPKLTSEELLIYRERLDKRGGMNKAAEATGLSRQTIQRIALAGTGTDKSIQVIRKFIKETSNQSV